MTSLFDLRGQLTPVDKNVFLIIEIVSRTTGGLKSLTYNKGVFSLFGSAKFGGGFGGLEKKKNKQNGADTCSSISGLKPTSQMPPTYLGHDRQHGLGQRCGICEHLLTNHICPGH